MNRKTGILLLLVVVLALAYWLVSKQPWRTTVKSADYFSIRDTGSVTKIFMANKQGAKVLLERSVNNNWLVNGNIPVDEPKIRLLLTTLHDMQIQRPIPPSMHNTAIGNLAVKGVKTEIYAGDKLIKTIYVGSETPDQTGTFMMLEGEDQTYAVHIPGFVGFLTPRFFLSEIKWRSKLVFDIPAENIQSLSYQYPKETSASFKFDAALFIEKKCITDFQNKEVAADTIQIKMLLHSFQQKYAEGYYDDSLFTPLERDSLYKLIPYCIITVKQKNGLEQTITLYEKPIGDKTKDRYDDKGRELTIDPEKFYVRLEGINQIASLQEYAFRRILVKAKQVRSSKF